MFFFTFHAMPSNAHPEIDSIGGAFINCWIDRPTLIEAETVARQVIGDAGWSIDVLEESRVTNRSDYSADPEWLDYYEQAVLDKEVFVFHRYPLDENRE